MSTRVLLAMGIIATAAVVVWLFLGRDDASGTEARSLAKDDGTKQVAAVSWAKVEAPSLPEAAGEASETGASQRAVVAGRLVGRVEDESGQGIAQALLSSTPLVAIEAAAISLGSWPVPAIESTVTAVSRVDGAFEFAREDSSSRAIWVTRPGYFARAVELDSGEHEDGLGPLILAEATPLVVSVLGPDGEPVVGAEVRHWAAPFWAVGREDRAEVRLARVFFRVESTGKGGRATLGKAPIPTVVQALKGELCSSTRLVWEEEDEIVLQLGQSFTFAATTTPLLDAEEYEEAVIDVLAWRDEGVDIDSSLPVRIRDGAVGPVRLPIVQGANYLASLSGGGFVTTGQRFPAPSPGDHVELQFEALIGIDLPVLALDPEARPVAGVDVWAAFVHPLGQVEETNYFLTGEDGRAVVRGCPEGNCTLAAEADGYVPLEIEDVRVPAEGEIAIVLQPAGRLRGVVTRAGVPVPDFQVLWWKGNPRSFEADVIEGSEDGSFEVEPVPAGDLLVMAVAAEHGRSEAVLARVEPGTEASVAIELSEALEGRGRIVDGATGEPIAGARVQLYSNHGPQLLDAYGDVTETGPDGSFRLVGVTPGDARAIVFADGFRYQLLSANAQAGEVADFGVMPLFRGRRLLVELLAPSGTDPTAFAVSGYGSARIPRASFDAAGRVEVEDLPPGFYHLDLSGPSGGQRVSVELRGDDPDWRVALDVRGSPVLRVRLVAPEGEVPPDAVWVRVTSATGAVRERRWWAGVDADHVATLTGISAGEAVIAAVAPSGEELATRSAAIADLPEQEIELHLTGSSALYRLVDRSRNPVPGTEVRVQCRDLPEIWSQTVITGTEGEFEVRSPPCEDLVASVSHATLGSAEFLLETPIDPSRPVDVLLDADRRVDVRCVDGAEPLPGVLVLLRTPYARSPIAWRPTNERGEVSFRGLGEGEYGIEIHQAGLWPVATPVASRRIREPSKVDVRRLGALAITVVDGLSQPVPLVEVEVRSVDLATPVSEWIASGRVPAPPGGLRTDEAGGILLTGLPRGDYACRAGVGSAGASETAVVPARGSGSITLRLLE